MTRSSDLSLPSIRSPQGGALPAAPPAAPNPLPAAWPQPGSELQPWDTSLPSTGTQGVTSGNMVPTSLPRAEDRSLAHLDVAGPFHAALAAARQGCRGRAGCTVRDVAWGPGMGLAIPVLWGRRGVAGPVQEVIKAVTAPEWVGPESRERKGGKGVGCALVPPTPSAGPKLPTDSPAPGWKKPIGLREF
jgi:hypothetical protein